MRAINDNVFIERFPTEKTFNEMFVAEKALTKNYKGVIKASSNDKYVGKEVLIPHYGVQDVLVDGEELALTKVSKLFAIKDGETYLPINRYVKVRKCTNDHIRDESGEIALYMTDNNIETTNWVEILDVATDCKTIDSKYIGYYCTAPEDSEFLARIGYTEDFCLHEDQIKFVTTGD